MRLGDDEEYVTVSASQEAYNNGATGLDIFAEVDVRVGDFFALSACRVVTGVLYAVLIRRQRRQARDDAV